MSDNKKVYGAISAVMAELAKSGISKGRKNAQQGYTFRGIDDIYNALATLLAEHKLLILPRCLTRTATERESKSGGALFSVVTDVEFDFVSAEDGSMHTVKMPGEGMDSADKATNKAMSAAYKYACLQVFCIPTEGDNDTDATTHEVKRASPAGYEQWKADMTALADEGTEPLQAAWKRSDGALRCHVVETDAAWWTDTKAKAEKATTAKAAA